MTTKMINFLASFLPYGIFPAQTGNRHFQQAYMELDDLAGRLRTLRQKPGAAL